MDKQQVDQAEIAKELVGKTTTEVPKINAANVKADKQNKSELRRVSILAIGDGGCTITSTVKKELKKVQDADNILAALRTVGFNLSGRNKGLFSELDKFSFLTDEDGSGMNRNISKTEMSKPAVHEPLVNDMIHHNDIAMVIATTGGGSGCGGSPTMAMQIENALIKNNKEAFTVVLGVAPKIEDYPKIYNTIEWMKEVQKLELPYLLFNNDRVQGTLPHVHNVVNEEIVKAIKVIMGTSFKSSDISSTDNKDVLTALNRSGRINVYYSNQMPGGSETSDEYIQKVIDRSSQEEPRNPHARVVFVKGPKEVIDRFNTSLPAITEKYGAPTIKYYHVEESKDVEIAIIYSGGMNPSNLINRLKDVKVEMEHLDRQRQEDKNEIDVTVNDPFASKRKTKSL
jgi:hypothetical protein